MTIAVAGRYALVAKYFPAMVGETESAAIALRTYNPQPAGPNKSRSQAPLGKIDLSTHDPPHTAKPPRVGVGLARVGKELSNERNAPADATARFHRIHGTV